MSAGDLSVCQHILYTDIKLQKTHAVCDRCAVLGYAVRNLFLCEMELLDQLLERLCFLDRIQIRTLDVLDQRDLHRLLLIILADQHRDIRDPRKLCSAPTALTGDDLVVIALFLDDQRL